MIGSVKRDEILRRIRAGQPALSRLGVKSLALFGSVARGDATAGSDVDLLVEFDVPVGLFGFLRVKQHLEEILGRRVDLVTRDALKPQLRAAILEEAVPAA
jgi:predicted nucleotidyltransferase